MYMPDPINEHKHISEDSSAKDEFLTEKQRRLIEYHFAVNHSLGFSESGQEVPPDQRDSRHGPETENPAHE